METLHPTSPVQTADTVATAAVTAPGHEGDPQESSDASLDANRCPPSSNPLQLRHGAAVVAALNTHFVISCCRGYCHGRASLVAQMVKNLPAMQFHPWVGKMPWRRE